ncbi:MAG: hypothetical protein SFX73_38340 [Kofleriaceae bacterium]|nr:hypothetical protein [Kofleriaceae bacterium]
MRGILLLILITTTFAGCGKKAETQKGPAISEADKTATPTDAQCDAYAAKSIEIKANPPNMKDYAKDLCLKGYSVALVKCAEGATKTSDLGDCIAKYPPKQ